MSNWNSSRISSSCDCVLSIESIFYCAVATVVARVVYVEFVALSPVFVPLEVHENVPENVPD